MLLTEKHTDRQTETESDRDTLTQRATDRQEVREREIDNKRLLQLKKNGGNSALPIKLQCSFGGRSVIWT